MQSFLKDEYGTGGKGFTIDGQKISIWYDNDGIRTVSYTHLDVYKRQEPLL